MRIAVLQPSRMSENRNAAGRRDRFDRMLGSRVDLRNVAGFAALERLAEGGVDALHDAEAHERLGDVRPSDRKRSARFSQDVFERERVARLAQTLDHRHGAQPALGLIVLEQLVDRRRAQAERRIRARGLRSRARSY